MGENALAEPDLDRLLAARLKKQAVIQDFGDTLENVLVEELKFRGLYGELAERARRKAEALSASPSLAGGRIPPLQLLVNWHFERRGLISLDVDQCVRSLALPLR